MKSLGQKLLDLRGDLSQAEAAKLSGISQQQWSKLERDLIPPDQSAVLWKVAAAFGVSSDDLRGASLTESNVSLGPLSMRESRLVPVVGRAKGGDEGYFHEEGYPVGHGNGFLVFPTRDLNAFGLLIENDSMDPVFPHKSYACVEPNEKYEPGDDVYVSLRDGRKLLKRLAWERSDCVRLDSYNASTPSITIDVAEIEAIYPATPVRRRHFQHE